MGGLNEAASACMGNGVGEAARTVGGDSWADCDDVGNTVGWLPRGDMGGESTGEVSAPEGNPAMKEEDEASLVDKSSSSMSRSRSSLLLFPCSSSVPISYHCRTT